MSRTHAPGSAGMIERVPPRMTAVQLTGHGGIETLSYREDVPTPKPGAGEVLIKVAAAAINNTDINTRIGWYSKKVADATCAGGTDGFGDIDGNDATWSGAPMSFPRIQGADCCGRIIAVGAGVDTVRIGERVIVRSMLRSYVDFRPLECWTFGSECDGAFAQYAKAPSRDTFAVRCNWTDVELASVPCAWSTAENMLHRASVCAEKVLITGASGGVGTAAVQLAKRRGAHVIAVAGTSKADAVRAIGADEVVDRTADPVVAIGSNAVDVVVDLVGGGSWPSLLDVLKCGGRIATAGAIGGPLVELDLRTLYLKDLSLFGCTYQDDAVFENLVSYIERGEVRPLVAKTFELRDIGSAQEEFIAKNFTGKLVLIPPA